jgi:hypothetical protein
MSISKEKFITKANIIHNGKYNYELKFESEALSALELSLNIPIG